MATLRANSVKWYGDRITREVRAAMLVRLDQAGRELVSQIQSNLSHPGPEPSAPGEFPHRQTGGLADAIGYEVDASKMVLKVAVEKSHERQAVALELGTATIEPRPFLTRTWLEFRRRMLDIMTQGARSSGGRGVFR